MRSFIDLLNAEIRQREANIADLQQQLDEATRKMEQAQNRLSSAQSELKEFEDAVEALPSSIKEDIKEGQARRLARAPQGRV